MAQRVEVQLTDDLDGTDIATGKDETLTFALDGYIYEIDLTNRNAGALWKALSPFIGAGRRVKTSRGAKIKRTQIGPDATTLREWARVNGHEVSHRGRVPNEIREAFEAANSN